MSVRKPPAVIQSLLGPLPARTSIRPVRHTIAKSAMTGVPLGALPEGLIDGEGPRRGMPIKFHPPPPSAMKLHPFAVQDVQSSQIALLDPSGVRTRLFARDNPEKPNPGDILHITFKGTTPPFSGVLLAVRRSQQETSILLRNEITRIAVEMWYKLYSPNITGIEIVQRRQTYHKRGKRARRAKVYFMRQPKHDLRSVEGTVRAYLRAKKGAEETSRSGGSRQTRKKKK